jgi:transposase InsO family protein
VRSHRNAKTTPKGRVLLVRRVLDQGWSVEKAAVASGLSERTVYKWLARYRHEGTAALEDGASAPHQSPHRTRPHVERWILKLRAERLSGPAIARRTGVARSTVGNVLRRHGVGRLKPIEVRPAIRRYEREAPGELVHVDTKALGRIGHIGHRITGNRQHQSRGIGWEHVHVCIDDASRLAYVEILPTQQKADAVGFMERAVAWFAGRGVRIERIMTDNGSAYRSRVFRDFCVAQGARHVRTRPYTPRTNGKAERFIQTLLREWAYARPYRTSGWRRRALKPWLGYYNQRRPHSALRDQAPITRLQRAAA